MFPLSTKTIYQAVEVLGRTDSNNGEYMVHALKAHSNAELSTWVSARTQITSSSLSESERTEQRSNGQTPLNDHMSEEKRMQMEYVSIGFHNERISYNDKKQAICIY